uniref:Uncharacterized protein n=1 Tax=Arundo donax TaxID=35708 RepID=A0A0A9DWX5_ARUDO
MACSRSTCCPYRASSASSRAAQRRRRTACATRRSKRGSRAAARSRCSPRRRPSPCRPRSYSATSTTPASSAWATGSTSRCPSWPRRSACSWSWPPACRSGTGPRPRGIRCCPS